MLLKIKAVLWPDWIKQNIIFFLAEVWNHLHFYSVFFFFRCLIAISIIQKTNSNSVGVDDKDTKLPSLTSTFWIWCVGGWIRVVARETRVLARWMPGLTLAAPRCTIRVCLSGPPLRSHMEHENFLRISHLTLAKDQTMSWKMMKVYWLNRTMRRVGEKTSKITFCFKKLAIFPPWTSLDHVNFRLIHFVFSFCFFLFVFSKRNCNNTETNNCCLNNSFISLFVLIFIQKSIGSDIIGKSDHSHYWSLEHMITIVSLVWVRPPSVLKTTQNAPKTWLPFLWFCIWTSHFTGHYVKANLGESL